MLECDNRETNGNSHKKNTKGKNVTIKMQVKIHRKPNDVLPLEKKRDYLMKNIRNWHSYDWWNNKIGWKGDI